MFGMTRRGRSGVLVAVVGALLWASLGGPWSPAAAQAPLPPAGACSTTSTRFIGTMSGAQEVPPVTTTATGTFDMQLLTDGTTLNVFIVVQGLNLAQVTAAHIHSPAAPGQNAPVSFPLFTGPPGTFTNPFTARLPNLPAAVLDAMRNGLAYVNIHTTANPGGEIRGQVECAAPLPPCTGASTSFVANLTPAQEVLAGNAPPPPSLASGVATLQLGQDGSTLAVIIDTSNLPLSVVTLSHIHSPAPLGQAAPVTVNLFLGPTGTFTDPFNVVVQVPPTVLSAMRSGLAYVNVHTVAFPGGEIRGQIECVPTPSVSPTSNPPPLSGQPNTPCASVVGQNCGISGNVQGVWTRTSSGTYTVRATGPANALPGSIPAVFFPTTAGVEGFACQPLPVSPPFTATCVGTTVGNLLQGAVVTVRFLLIGGGTADVVGTVTGAGAGPAVSTEQAINQVQPSGQPGLLCAVQVGATCQVTGAVTGSGTVTGSMAWTLTANVPPNVPAGAVPVAVLSTHLGLQAFPCAPTAQGARTVACNGSTTGNALQGSTVTVVFGTGATVTGTVQGTPTPPPLVPPAAPLPLPPLNLLPPPAPPLLPPLPPAPPRGLLAPPALPGPGAPLDLGALAPAPTPTPAPAADMPAGTPPLRSLAPGAASAVPAPEPASVAPAPEPMSEPAGEPAALSVAPGPEAAGAPAAGADEPLPALAEEP